MHLSSWMLLTSLLSRSLAFSNLTSPRSFYRAAARGAETLTGSKSGVIGRESRRGSPRFTLVPISASPSALSMSTSASPPPEGYDYLVIGAGSGGMASARRAASLGAKVAVVESARLGGTCVNVGCVPKKVMWNAASIAETLHDMSEYGFTGSSSVSPNWAYLKSRRDAYVARLNGIYKTNLGNSEVDTLVGLASFTSTPGEVLVTSSDGSTQTYKAKNVLVATGGYPTFPPGEGIADHAISSDGFFELEEQPGKVVVVGAGYIAVELAGVLNALGSETSLVLRKGKALREFDDLISDVLDGEMVRQGMDIRRNTDGVKSIEINKNGKKTVTLHNGDVIDDVDCVLMAAGRSPLVDPLNLPAIGVKQTPKGHIVVDEFCATNVPNLYAVGDVCGKVELTPMAIAAGRRLSDKLFGGDKFNNAKANYEGVPTVVFSHPPIGTIGLTEKQAKEKYGEENIKVYTSKFANLWYGIFDKTFAEKPATAMKMITQGPTEVVVGLHGIGMGVDEMMQGFGVAMKMGATKADFDATVAIHPTASEEFVTLAPWGLSGGEDQYDGVRGSK